MATEDTSHLTVAQMPDSDRLVRASGAQDGGTQPHTRHGLSVAFHVFLLWQLDFVHRDRAECVGVLLVDPDHRLQHERQQEVVSAATALWITTS